MRYRRPAWGNRATPSPGPAVNANTGNIRSVANGFPPLGSQTNGKPPQSTWGTAEDKERLLASLAGSIVSILFTSIFYTFSVIIFLTWKSISPLFTDF